MGGTSFDVGVIVGGAPAVSADKEMGYGLPVRVPMIDIHTIGAGGGSIARVSSAGILQVGPGERGRRSRAHRLRPRRRGAHHHRREPAPRPAQPGRRSSAWTGGARLDRVREIVDKKIGAHLGLDPDGGRRRHRARGQRQDGRAPSGWCRSSAATTRATSCCSRSAAPGRSTPWPWPASWRSRRCWCRRGPGITSALGCLVADVRHDFVRTINQGLLRMDVAEARRDPGRPDRRGPPPARHRGRRGRDRHRPARGGHAVRRSDPRADRAHRADRLRARGSRGDLRGAPTGSASGWSCARCAPWS